MVYNAIYFSILQKSDKMHVSSRILSIIIGVTLITPIINMVNTKTEHKSPFKQGNFSYYANNNSNTHRQSQLIILCQYRGK